MFGNGISDERIVAAPSSFLGKTAENFVFIRRSFRYQLGLRSANFFHVEYSVLPDSTIYFQFRDLAELAGCNILRSQ